MKKRILTVLVSLAVALALLPTAAWAEYTGGISGDDWSSIEPPDTSDSGGSTAAGAEEAEAETWEELIAAIEGTASSIRLENDLTREAGKDAITIGRDLTIDLGSHTLNGGGQDSVIVVENGGELTIEDKVEITGNSAEEKGGGIYLAPSYFTMAGGSITGNTAKGEDDDGTPSGKGGGVANAGTFTMTGGAIHSNTAAIAANDFYNMLSGAFTLRAAEDFGDYSWYRDGSEDRTSDTKTVYTVKENDAGMQYLTAGERLSYTITATAGAGGAIDPSGETTVEKGGSKTYTIAPSDGYHIESVTVDGQSVDAVGSYTFENITGDHTISVTFALNSTPGGDGGSGGGGGSSSGGSSSYTVTPGRTENGSVSVSPSRASYGRTVTVTVEAEEGYELEALTVTDRNGEEVELTRVSDTEYTFTMPRSRVTVEAVFAEIDHADVCPGRVYADLDPDAWYHAAVDYVIENGMMDGVGGGLFAPGSSLSRAMMAQVLWNLAGNPEASAAAEYGDVASDAWYHDAVQWAAAEGIVDGYGNGVYGPEDDITREQMALMLYRCARYMGCDTAQGGMEIREFSDYEAISDWALEAMTWAVNAGVLNGRGGGVLDPAGHATRAEAAQILMNFRENAAK